MKIRLKARLEIDRKKGRMLVLPFKQHTCRSDLKFTVIDGSWEWDHVTDIAHAGQVHDTSLKTETESGMSHRTVLSKIQVETIVFFIETKLLHTGDELIIIILTLAAADDLPDARN